MRTISQSKKIIHNLSFIIPAPQEGFTLLEVIIYSAILAIFIGAAFIFTSTILGNSDNLMERNEVVTNITFFERKFDWLLGRATSISAPVPNSFSTTTVQIEGNEAGIYPAILTFENGEIKLSLAGGNSMPLTNNRVRIVNFLANHYSNSQLPSHLKLSVGFQSKIYPTIIITSTISYALPR